MIRELHSHYENQYQRTQRVLLYDSQTRELIVKWNAPKQLWKSIDQWWNARA